MMQRSFEETVQQRRSERVQLMQSLKENQRKLGTVVGYCEDNVTCRRQLMLNYFGEAFNREVWFCFLP
jgi:superfamily II DNA helicase RecQ